MVASGFKEQSDASHLSLNGFSGGEGQASEGSFRKSFVRFVLRAWGFGLGAFGVTGIA